MTDNDEFMSLEVVDGIEKLAGFGGSCRPEFILDLCKDVRKLKQRVEELEAEVRKTRDAAFDSCTSIAKNWKSALRPGTEDRLAGHKEASMAIAKSIISTKNIKVANG